MKMQYNLFFPLSSLGVRGTSIFISPLADTLHILSLNYFLCHCDGEVKENDKSDGVNMEFIYCINGGFLWEPFKLKLLTDWRNDSLGSCERQKEEMNLHGRECTVYLTVFIICYFVI